MAQIASPVVTLSGQHIDVSGVPGVCGAPGTEHDLIAGLITMGHSEGFALHAAAEARRNLVHTMWCHSVHYHPATGLFTYIGR